MRPRCRAGRDPASVRLVAVSKTQPAAFVNEAAAGGQRLFGENYVQELAAKAVEVKVPVEWHFIGHLQSNKVKQIAGLVTMIHSVDRLSLAEEIDRQWGRLGKVCDILIQVNISCEPTKSGTTSEELLELVSAAARLPHVRVRGLMTMPPFFDDPEGARPYFRQLGKPCTNGCRRETGRRGDDGAFHGNVGRFRSCHRGRSDAGSGWIGDLR